MNISASTINYTTLTLNSNGVGVAGGLPAEVSISAQGSYSFADNENPFDWSLQGSFSQQNGPLAISGSGALTASASGNYSEIYVAAAPVNISGAGLTLKSEGNTSHQVLILNTSISGTTGLTMSETGSTTIDANANTTWGSGANGGTITFFTDNENIPNSAPFTVEANASSSSGNGGTISITTNTVSGSVSPTFSADGPSSGTGNGGNINIQPQSGFTYVPTLGVGIGQFPLSAKSGHSGGKGGNVQVTNSNGPISVTAGAGPAINVGAAAATGNGGTINLTGQQLNFASSSNLVADGGTSIGNGGSLSLNSTGNLTIGTPLSAKAPGNGDGGSITINSMGNLTLASTLSAQALKDGNGGTISVDANTNTANISGSLLVNVMGEGDAGMITVKAGPLTLSGFISAQGGTTGGGNGGTIKITGAIAPSSGGLLSVNPGGVGLTPENAGTITITGTSTQPFSIGSGGLSLNGQCPVQTTGNGATFQITSAGPVSVDGNGVFMSPCESEGIGGNFALTASQITVTNTLSADSTGSKLAGTINLNQTDTSSPMILDGATISASGAGNGTGDGNQITISSAYNISAVGSNIFANGGGDGGDGGKVTVTLGSGASPVDVSTTKFEARGNVDSSTTGKGGSIVVNNATGHVDGTGSSAVGINVSLNFDVDGGSDSSVTDMGSLSLNSVTCHQWKTNAAVYPLVGWDCIDPDGGSYIPTLVTAATSLSATLQGQLQNLISPSPANPHVSLYAMPSLLIYQEFFGLPQTPPYDNQFGISYVSYLRQSATFQQSSNGDNVTLSGSPTIMVGALVHELGHEFDYIWGPGQTNYSEQTSWTDLIPLDFATMDGQPCNSVFFQATCNANPNLTNSQIFRVRFSAFFKPSGEYINGEFFAAMFEHVESFLTGNPPSYTVDPELEKTLDTMLRLKSAMSGLIASPPVPQK